MTALARIVPWRWTWEWLFVFVAPFAIFWHQAALSEIGDVDIRAIERSGRTVPAMLTKVSGGPKDKLQLLAWRFAFFTADLTWHNVDGIETRATNVRINPYLGIALGLSSKELKLPHTVSIRIATRPTNPAPTSPIQNPDAVNPLPACQPWANCNLYLLHPNGGPSFDPMSRSWHIWGETVIWACVVGFFLALGARLAGKL